MMRRRRNKDKEKEPDQAATGQDQEQEQPAAEDQDNLAEDNEKAHTCENCANCDLRNYGFCNEPKAREQLDLWNGIIFKPAEFGCMHWTQRTED